MFVCGNLMSVSVCACPASEGPALEVVWVVFDGGLGVSVISCALACHRTTSGRMFEVYYAQSPQPPRLFFYPDLFLFNKLQYSIKKELVRFLLSLCVYNSVTCCWFYPHKSHKLFYIIHPHSKKTLSL